MKHQQCRHFTQPVTCTGLLYLGHPYIPREQYSSQSDIYLYTSTSFTIQDNYLRCKNIYILPFSGRRYGYFEFDSPIEALHFLQRVILC